MSTPVYPTTELIQRLKDLILARYPIVLTEETLIRLYMNDVTPDENSSFASFVPSAIPGTDAIKVVMTAPSISDQGLVVSKSNLCNWSVDLGEDPQMVYGVYLYTPDDILIAAQRFDTPQTLGGGLPTAVTGIWRCSEPLTGYGWVDVEN